jgi:hypothetical protein
VDWWSSSSQDCRVCNPVSGDFDVEFLRNWLYGKAEFCGSIWTDDECLREKNDDVEVLWLEYMCEWQQLRAPVGFSDTAWSSGCVDDRVVDYCDKLNKISREVPSSR